MTDVFSGSSPAQMRRANLAAVLEYAWDADDITASDVMARVGLTRSTTIDVIDELVDRALLRELSNARSTVEYRKGRPSRRFELCADAGVVVGIDAGRGHLITTVSDLRGTTLVRGRSDLDPEDDAPGVRRKLVGSALDSALAEAGLARADVVALCIGVPAPVDALGVSPAQRDGFWQRMNPGFVAEFGAVPFVRVENDAYLAALAERETGAAIDRDNFAVLLAGERLGAGIAVDGRLLRGAHGGAGEMGALDHVRGVGGAMGLGHRLADLAREAVTNGEVPADHPFARLPARQLDGRLVLELTASGDSLAVRISQRVGDTLAVIAAVLGSLFDSRLILVSGAIADGIEPVLEAARRALPAELDLPAPEIRASTLGADIVSIGAVAAAVETARAGMLDLTRAARSAG